MKTWEDPMEDENGTILNRYIITECESVDDVLSLDATVEGQRLQRALTAPHISDIDEWLWDLEDNQDPDALRPDEVVFLDDEHTWYHVKGSGLCLANGCSAEYWLPYMFTDENRWETFYLDRDHSKLFHSGMPRLWIMNPSAFMPCNDWQEGYTVANPERPASVYGQQDPFIQGRTPDDALIFHQGDSASPEDCCRDDSVSVSLAQYQKILREYAPFEAVELRYHPKNNTDAGWTDMEPAKEE